MTKIFKKGGLLFFFLLLTAISVSAITDTVFSDIDGDGDLDIYLETVIENNAGVFYNRTNASGIPLFNDLIKGHFVDFNGDGREDLYIVRDNAVNQLYLRNASVSNWNFTNYTNSVIGQRLRGKAGSPVAAVFADFTNDGNIDAFVNGELWLTTTTNFDFNATNRSNVDEMPNLVWVKAKDVNLDNLTDIIGTTAIGKMVVYLSLGDTNNDEAPEFYPAEVDIGLSFEQNISFVEVGNIETGLAYNSSLNYYPFVNDTPPFVLDKFEDFYLVKENETNVLYTQLWPQLPEKFSTINTSDFYLPQLFNLRPTSVNDSRNGSMAIMADFDNNTFVDILVANHDNESLIMLRNGSSWSQEFVDSQARFNTTTNIKLIETVDLNNDGELDFAIIDPQEISLQQLPVSGSSDVSIPAGEPCTLDPLNTFGDTEVEDFTEMEEFAEGAAIPSLTFEEETAPLTSGYPEVNINFPTHEEFSANPPALAEIEGDSIGYVTEQEDGTCTETIDGGEYDVDAGTKELNDGEINKEPSPPPPVVVGPPTIGGPGGRINVIQFKIICCDPKTGTFEEFMLTQEFKEVLGSVFTGIQPPAEMPLPPGGILLEAQQSFGDNCVQVGENYVLQGQGGPSIENWMSAQLACMPKITEREPPEFFDEIPGDFEDEEVRKPKPRITRTGLECICPPEITYCDDDICGDINSFCTGEQISVGPCGGCGVKPAAQVTKILRDIILPQQATFDAEHLKWEPPSDKIGPIKPKTKPPVPEAPTKMSTTPKPPNLMIEEVFVWKISYPEEEPIAAVAAETALTADSISVEMSELAEDIISPEVAVTEVSAVSITGAAISDIVQEERTIVNEVTDIEISPILFEKENLVVVDNTPLDLRVFMPSEEDELNDLIDLVTVDEADLLSDKDLEQVKSELRKLGMELLHEQNDLHSVSLICLTELKTKLDDVSEKEGLIPPGKADAAINDISDVLVNSASSLDIANSKDKLTASIGVVENYVNEVKPYNDLKDTLNSFKAKSELSGQFNYDSFMKLSEIKELTNDLYDEDLNNDLEKLNDLIFANKVDDAKGSLKKFAEKYEDVLLNHYSKKIDSSIADFKDAVAFADYEQLISASSAISDFVDKNQGNNKIARLLQGIESDMLNKNDISNKLVSLSELISSDATEIPELNDGLMRLGEKLNDNDIQGVLDEVSGMKKQAKNSCFISDGQPIVYEYFTQDFELANKQIQEKMKKASETVSELYTIVAKLMGQVDDEDEDYDLSDLKFEMYDKIKESSSFFFFKNQYFEDLKLLFKLSPVYSYMKDLRTAIFSVSEELNSLDVVKPEQIDYYNDRLDKIMAGINSLRAVLLSQSGKNIDLALSPYFTGAIDEGTLDVRVSDRAHALTAEIMDKVDNDVPVSDAARAANILAETFEKEIPEVKDLTEPSFEKYEEKEKIAEAKDLLEKELKQDEFSKEQAKIADIKKEIFAKTEERKLADELAAVSDKITDVSVKETLAEEVAEEEKAEEEKAEPEEKKKKKEEEKFSKEEKLAMEKFYNKGMYAFKNEDYKDAIKNFGEYLRINPLNADVLWHTADSLKNVEENYLSTKTAEAVEKVKDWKEFVQTLEEIEGTPEEKVSKFVSEVQEKVEAPSSRFIEPAAYVLLDMTDCFTEPLQEFVVEGKIYNFYGVKEEVDEQGAVKYFIEATPNDKIETVTFEIPELISTLKEQIGFCKVDETEEEKKPPKPTPTNDDFAQALANDQARKSTSPDGEEQVCMEVESDVSALSSVIDVQKTTAEVCAPYDDVAALSDFKEPDKEIKLFEEMKFPTLEPDFELLKQSNVRENLYDIYRITQVLNIVGDYQLDSGESKLFVLGDNLFETVKVRRKVSRKFLNTLEKMDYTPPPKCSFKGGSATCTQFDQCVVIKGKLTCSKSFSEKDCTEVEGKWICEGYNECKKEGEEIICEQRLKEDCIFGRDAEGNIVVEQCEGFEEGECKINDESEIECESSSVEIPSDCERVGLGDEEYNLICAGFAGASCKMLDSGQVYCKESGKLPEGCAVIKSKFVCEDPVLQETLKDCVIEEKTGEFSCGEGDLEWFFDNSTLKSRPKPKFSERPGEDCVYVDDKFICGEGLPEMRNIPHGCVLVNDELDCYYDPKIQEGCAYKDGVLECEGYERGACGFKTDEEGDEQFSCVKVDVVEFEEGCTISGCEGYSASECGFSNGEYVCESAEKQNFPEGCDFDSDNGKILCGSAELDLPEDCVATSEGIKCNSKNCYYKLGKLVCENG